ncbi:L,D-transpeptidase family protein [Lacticaseibacillus porcinae]|uniref:L,D-transpeptidase family protein n=1 Tax=Lacticaseibacillus porcinae TaxID=1123687 RepID=UPI000F796B9C|nr:L,D-transpeptidase family protein [Lacticaseibacillus porcinae]
MKNKRVWIGSVVVIALLAFGGYAMRSHHYQNRFLPKTQVLGVDVGNQTVTQANKTLRKHFTNTSLKFVDQNQTVATASGTELGLKQNFTQTLTQLLKKQNPWAMSATVLAQSQDKATLTNGNTTLVNTTKQITAKLNQTRKAPVDAKVVAQSGKYVVQKEQAGNQIDATKLATAVTKAVSTDKTKVDVTSTYTQPKVTSDSDSLKKAATELSKIASIKAQVKITNQLITIPTDKLQSWLSYDNGVQVDLAKVEAYTAELANTYNTYGKTRTFKSTKRGTVTVPAGTYGWTILQTATAKNLVAEIKKGQDFTKEVSYEGSGYHSDGTDIGSTYVEVDVQNQHEYFYQNGKLVLDSDVVTGKPGQDTPKGVDFVWAKNRDKTLTGKNDDGSNYASKVSYWMPIDYTGVGLHDAPWQPKFGGDWYKQHGSHGCVNNPVAFMAKLYDAVPLGTPVIVF